MLNFSNDAKKLSDIFTSHGYEIYAVGGSVRDALLGKTPDDIDFCTDATPEEMLKMFPYSIKTGIKHGTLTIPFNKNYYEITTYRIDGKYTDSRHPDTVNYSRSLKEDLSRRDFTINAMAVEVKSGTLIDIFCGIEDLKNHVIRTVGNPVERFNEDALRMLRAIRFQSKLGFFIEKNTYNAIKQLEDNIKNVSTERIRTEFLKILESPYALEGIDGLIDTKLWRHILPFTKFPSNKNGTHYFNIKLNDKINPILVLTAIFITITNDEEIVKKSTAYLKLSNAEMFTILHIFKHAKIDLGTLDTSFKKRKFLSSLKREYFDNFFDTLKILNSSYYTLKDEFGKFINDPLSIRELDISGNDILSLGLSGQEVRKALEKCLDEVLKDPILNKRSVLLNIAKI